MFSLLYRKISVCSSILVLIIVLILFPSIAQAATVPDPQATAAILIEANSGRIIYQKNADTPLPPASTSKIISAITALDMVDLSEQHKISAKAAQVGESSINLQVGEVLTTDDLLKGALIRSGNDACFALGEAVAGDEDLFVHWLNLKAATLGATSATLYNTNGLPYDGHEISARDLAYIARYAMKNDNFAEIVASKYAQIGSGKSTRTLKSTNKLLWQCDAVTGIKTGTTDAAGSCLIASMQSGDMQFISVVLHSPDRYGESMELLKYGADNYQLCCLASAWEIVGFLPVRGGNIKYLPIQVSSDAYLLYAKDKLNELHVLWQLPVNLTAPVAYDQTIGYLKVYDAEDNQIMDIRLSAAAAAKKSFSLFNMPFVD